MATNRRLLNAGKGPVRDLDAERKKANELEAAALTNTLLYGNAYKPLQPKSILKKDFVTGDVRVQTPKEMKEADAALKKVGDNQKQRQVTADSGTSVSKIKWKQSVVDYSKTNDTSAYTDFTDSVIKNTRESRKTEYDHNKKLENARKDRENYVKAGASGRNPSSSVYTKYDGTKPVSKDDVIVAGNVLAEKVRNGTATDDDYRRYVNTEALYGEGLYNAFNDRISVTGRSYGVVSDDDIWKSQEEYEAEANALYGDINALFEKFARGEATDAELNAMGARKKKFDECEKVYFSDEWSRRGTIESAETLNRQKDNAKKAYEDDLDGADTRNTYDSYLTEAWNWEASNPNYVDGVISDDNPYKVLVDEYSNKVAGDTFETYQKANAKYQRAFAADSYDELLKDYDNYKQKWLEKPDGKKVDPSLGKYSDRYTQNVPGKTPTQYSHHAYKDLYNYGTDEQKKIYEHIFYYSGHNEAIEYAETINPIIAEQAHKANKKKYEDSGDWGRLGMGISDSFMGGLAGDFVYNMEGVGRLLTGDTSYHFQNVAQQKANAVSEAEENPVAKFSMAALRTTGAQIPMIITSMATGGASGVLGNTSSVLFFASAAGSSYSESINKGNGYWESVGYAGTVAGFETATEKIFDIPKLYGGSKVDDAITGAISRGIGKLNAGAKTKAALSFAGYMGVNALGEGFEEGVAELFSPVWSNLWLGEQNEMFTEEHWKEIGYASLLGSASALLMGGLTMPQIYSEAKGDTAVWSILNGKGKSIYEVDAVLNNESSKKLFEKVIGIELSDNTDVARMQVAAVSSAVSAWYAKNSGKKVSDLMKTLSVSDAGSVAEFVEMAAEVIPEPDAEYVANETAAVAEMTEIANKELKKTTVDEKAVPETAAGGIKIDKDGSIVLPTAEEEWDAAVERSRVNEPKGSIYASAMLQIENDNDSEVFDNASLINKLKAAVPDLNKKNPVIELTGNEFERNDNKKLSEMVIDFFNTLKNKVTRKGFGDVIVDEKGVKSSIAHGIGRSKAIAFAAVPEVIKNGEQIDFQSNWKDRGYDTYVFAAPVKIGASIGIVGTVVIRNKADNKFYLHEVIDSEGNILKINKDTASFKTESVTDKAASSGDAVSSDNSIPQRTPGVKIEKDGSIMLPTAEGEINAAAANKKDILPGFSDVTTETTEMTGRACGVSEENIGIAVRLSHALGVKVAFYEDLTSDERGQYLQKTGVIWVNSKYQDVFSNVFGHELTHRIEKSRFYAKLAAFVEKRLKAEGKDINVLIKQKQESYARRGTSLSDEAARREVVAKYVGEVLLNNEAVIADIARTDSGLGGFLLSKIDSLVAKITGKNKEAVYIRRVQQMFRKALEDVSRKEGAKVSDGSEQQRGSVYEDAGLNELAERYRRGDLSQVEYLEAYNEYMERNPGLEDEDFFEGRSFDLDENAHTKTEQTKKKVIITQNDVDAVRMISKSRGEISINEFGAKEVEASSSWAKKFFDEIKVKSPFFRLWFGDWRVNDQTKTPIIHANENTGKNPRGLFVNKDTGWSINSSSVGYDETVSHSGKDKLSLVAMRSIDKIIENSVLFDTEVSSYGRGKKSIYTAFMHKFYSYVIIDGRPCIAKMAVDESYAPGQVDTNKKFYHVRAIKIEPISSVGIGFNHTPIIDETDSNIIVSDLFELVKTYDKEFNPKPVSKVVNDDGTPIVMYHGTNADENFTVFDSYGGSFGLFGIGSYFTSDRGVAESYTKKGKGSNPRVYEVYLNIKNPLDMDAVADKKKWYDAVDPDDKADFIRYTFDATSNEDMFKALKELCADNEMYREDAYDYITNTILAMGYDGITHIGGGRFGNDNGVRHRVFITFDPEQVKSATDNIGTFDKNNPDIRYDFDDANDFADDEMLYDSSLASEADAAEKLKKDSAKFERYNRWRNDKDAYNARGLDGESWWNKNRNKADRMFNKRELERLSRIKSELEDADELTVEQVTALWGEMRKLQRNVTAMSMAHQITNEELTQVTDLLRSDRTIEDIEKLPADRYNIDGIIAVAKAKLEYENVASQIREFNARRKAKLHETADGLIKDADIKDKSGFASGLRYRRETMERNVRDVVKDKSAADAIIGEYFSPVHKNEADRTRFKEKLRDRIRKLGISTKVEKGNQVSEAYAVQFYGEVADNIAYLEQNQNRVKHREGKDLEEWRALEKALWEDNPNLDKGKIERAVEEFRKIYDELYQSMNEVRVRNGYEPVKYRRGYFPHFAPGTSDGVLAKIAKGLGINSEVTDLPTTINGLTHTFKPGIKWMGNILERTGFATEYDALTGFDRYLEAASDVIYHTDDIQKLRALSTRIRYNAGDEGIKKQADEIKSREGLSDAEKQTLLDELYKDGKFNGSNFTVVLDDYTNILAGKKSISDRNAEYNLGRKMYNVVKGLESRVAANMIAGNLASALTNFIPITQAASVLDPKVMTVAAYKTLQSMINGGDGIQDTSDFLTNRRGSDLLALKTSEKISKALSKPMEFIDSFASGTIVRARFYDNLQRGMSEDAALEEADSFAASVIADRSKGSMPVLFEQKNPLVKLFTQFQLEVNNQLSFATKDLWRDESAKAEHGKNALTDKAALRYAFALFRFALMAFLFDELYEWLIGRRPALDPIGMIVDYAEDAQEDGAFEALGGLGEDVAENMPFIGGLMGGGRIPISSALPDINKIYNSLSGDANWKKKAVTVGKEVSKPFIYLVPPFGGGLGKKVIEGTSGMIQGGSYTVDSDGNAELQYPIYNDSVGDTIWNGAKSVLFGRTSTAGGQKWIKDGFKNFTADYTEAYKGMIELDGVSQKEAYEFLDGLRNVKDPKKGDDVSVNDLKRQYIEESGIDDAAKGIAFYYSLANDKEKEFLYTYRDSEDFGAISGVLMGMKEHGNSVQPKRELLLESELETDVKRDIYESIIVSSDDKEKESAKIDAFEDAGMTVDDYLSCRNKKYELDNDDGLNASGRATEFARWVDNNFKPKQADIIKENVKFSSGFSVSADNYEKYREAGLSPDEAYNLINGFGELEPEDGKDQVSDWQKARVIVDGDLSDEDKLTSLGVVLSSGTYERVSTAYDKGISFERYFDVKDEYDSRKANYTADEKDSYADRWNSSHGRTSGKTKLTFNQIMMYEAIEGIGGDLTLSAGGITTAPKYYFTKHDKAVLWQILDGEWSHEKNPFDTSVGLDVRKSMGWVD